MTDPSIAELDDFLDSHALVLAVRPTDTGLDDPDAVDILISDAAGDLRLTVFDEYGDARTGNRHLLCVLCSQELGEVADAEDFDAWRKAHSLDASLAARTAYERNRRTQATLLDKFGTWPDVVSDLDWQLDAGTAQTLRQLARKSTEG